MKRVILMVDAAADFPFPELEDRTPLQVARMPHARRLAGEGCNGVLKRTRSEADASRALLAEACGLRPADAADLRWGPVAAASLGVGPEPDRMYVLCRFVSHDSEEELQSPVTPSGVGEQNGLLSDMERWIAERCGESARLHSLSPGRFVLDVAAEGMTWPRMPVGYDHLRTLKRLPPRIRDMVRAAEEGLAGHSVNAVRLDLGEPPINGMWCWSGGTVVPPPGELDFPQALVSSDPLVEGMARCWGRTFLSMDDPYGLDRPDAAFDMAGMIRMLEAHEEVVVWLPAPFSTRKYEGAAEKVRRLDAVDYYVTGPLRALLEEWRPCRLLLTAAGVRHRGRPEKGPAPCVLWGDGVASDDVTSWSETDSPGGSLATPKFSKLLELLRQ